MFRIGEFSRIARVSARLLRYYDELGLLKPGVVDRASGYRYYTSAQLQRLNRILVLRDLGLTLEQIGGVIDQDASADQLRAMLEVRRADAERALAEEAGAPAADRGAHRATGRRRGRSRRCPDPRRARAPHRRRCATPWARSSRRGRSSASWRARCRSGCRVSRWVRSSASRIPTEFEPDAIDVELGFVLNGESAGRTCRRSATAAAGARTAGRAAHGRLRARGPARARAPDHREDRPLCRGQRLPARRAEPRSFPAPAAAGSHGGIGGGDAVPGRRVGERCSGRAVRQLHDDANVDLRASSFAGLPGTAAIRRGSRSAGCWAVRPWRDTRRRWRRSCRPTSSFAAAGSIL